MTIAPKIMYYGVYTASVVNNKDPLNQGRVTLRIPQILGTAVSNWAVPLGNTFSGVPALNSIVTVAFTGGDINHPIYMTSTTALPGLSVGEQIWLVPSGRTDSTDLNNITSALALGLAIVLAPGSWFLTSTIDMNIQGAQIAGITGTSINTAASFIADTSGCMISITADFCSIRGIRLNGAINTSSVQIGGISVSGAQHVRIDSVYFHNLSWYSLVAQGTASTACHDLQITTPIMRNCAGGIWCVGNSGTSFQGEYFIVAPQLQQIGATTGFGVNLDAIRLEDIEDVIIVAPNVGVAFGTGSALHIKGACSTLSASNIDLGCNVASGAGPVILIESGTNGTPSDINIQGGSTQGGINAVLATAGTNIEFMGVRGHQAWVAGWSFANGVIARLDACWSSTANQSATATTYEFDMSALTSSAIVVMDGCIALSPIGSSTAGEVTNVVSATSQVYVYNCLFLGTGTTPSNSFTGTPRVVRSTIPYNPRGSVTTPGVGTSPYTPPGSQNDLSVYFLTVGGATAFAIGGTTVATPPLAGVCYRVPARQTMTVTWSGTTPTWQWIAD